MKHRNIGSDFDDFLKEEGILEETEAIAAKRAIAYQIQQAMEAQGMSKMALSEKIGTSRSSLDRLLDPAYPSLSLKTLVKATASLGKKLSIRLV